MLQSADIGFLLNQTATRRLRFENVVNELLDAGLLTKDKLVIIPKRTTAYSFERDIKEVRERFNEQHQTYWQFGIPRDGFYDMLPERLFHEVKKRTKSQNEWAEIRLQEANQEKESRFFFLPFDNEFNHLRVAIDRLETRTLAGDDELLVAELLKLVAPDVDGYSLNPAQKVMLFLLITQAYALVGNWSQTAHYMSHFLAVPVHIHYSRHELGHQSTGQFERNISWQANGLGDSKLGLDWVLPQFEIVDDNGLIRLTIGPLQEHQLRDFLPNGLGQRQLHLLAGYLFPVDSDWRLELRTDTEILKNGFRLSAAETTGRLGLTTTLVD